jgi:predicted DNA-binding transcriptional regulator YafY
VLHGGRWYLAAHDDRSGEVRTFRVDRVRSAEARRERAAVPEGIDAADHVARSMARIPWGSEIEVALETTLEEARRRIPRTVGDPQEIDGEVVLRAQTDDLDAAARALASLPWPFTVRRPEELRESLRKISAMLAASAG